MVLSATADVVSAMSTVIRRRPVFRHRTVVRSPVPNQSPLPATDRATRLRAKDSLFTEQAYFPLVEQAGLISWEGNGTRSRLTHVGTAAGHLLGYPIENWYSRNFWMDHLHTEDRERVKRSCEDCLLHRTGFDVEYRMLRVDGGIVWLRDIGCAVPGGGPSRTLRGLLMDITMWKETKQRTDMLGRSLIAFQEDERKRIGRELHDDITQRLSLLAVDLDLLARCAQGIRPTYKNELERVTANVRSMASDVQALSHRLHPSKLEQLGLVPALKSLCRDVGKQGGIRAGFSSSPTLPTLSGPVQLCIYRVAQECLRNVIKHSKATGVHVELRLRREQLSLSITDDGIGIDPKLQRTREGLGFVSMRERLRIVDGRFTVRSKPGEGTRIEVCVPCT